MQKTYFKQSIEFGTCVQDQFRERALRNDLGVREQGLLVLAQTSMPGVLIETGFISNPQEERYLMTEYGQDIIASAIFRGFREYKEEIERRSNFNALVREDPGPETEDADLSRQGAALAERAMDLRKLAGETKTDGHGIPADQVVFRIQVASTRNKVSPDASSFKGYRDINMVQDGRWYKYMVGFETGYKEALDRCLQVKEDFPDAFVVALKNGKLIPIHEAILEINQ
jgi:N-acetylmuramoyl-L-alanine amidase